MNKKKLAFNLNAILMLLLMLVLWFTNVLYTRQGAYLGNPSLKYNMMQLAMNVLPVFVVILVGLIKVNSAVKLLTKIYVSSYLALFAYQAVFYIRNFPNFKMWNVFGMILPIISGVSPIFTGIIISLLLKPLFEKLVSNYSSKQSAAILTGLSLLVWALSANQIVPMANVYGLLISFLSGWGVWLRKVTYNGKKATLFFVAALIIAFLVVQSDQVVLSTFANTQIGIAKGTTFLSYSLSAFVVFIAAAIVYLVKPLFMETTETTSVLVTVFAALSWNFLTPDFSKYLNQSSTKIKYGVLLGSFVLILCLGWLLNRFVLSHLVKGIKETDQVAFLLTIWQNISNFCKKYKRTLLTWLYFIVIAWVTLIIVSDNFRISQINNYNLFWYILTKRMFVPILTAIFMYAVFEVLCFITTRYWVSLILTSLAFAGLAVADMLKVCLRGEPIYPVELSEVVNAQSLLSMLNPKTVIGLGVGIVIIVALTIFLEIKFPQKLTKVSHRAIFAVIGILVWLTPIKINDKQSPIFYLNKAFDNQANFSNPLADLQTNGPFLMMLDYSSAQVMEKPAGYSEANIQQLVNKYKKQAAQINKNRPNNIKDQTFIFNLSESFTDPTEFPGAKFKATVGDPMPYIRSLMRDTTNGKMLSAGYGGGTANMEYESLTGFNMGFFSGKIMPYQQVVQNYSFYPNIGMHFNYSAAIHPFYGTYYSRKRVYQVFKFNKFAYLGSKYKIHDQKKLGYAWYLSDQTLYKNAELQLKEHKGSQFINLMSMQNHLPYNSWYPNNEYLNQVKLSTPTSAGIDKHSFATYTKGVQYTDKAVKDFIAYLDSLDRPVIYVFYGDHYPGIIDQSQLKVYPIKLHATTYFIYANKYAREHNAKAKVNNDKYVNTSDFIAMALEQANAKVSPYQALLTKIHNELPAITINYDNGQGFELVDKKGNKEVEKNLTAKQKALLNDLRMIQYDMTQGKNYSLKDKGFY